MTSPERERRRQEGGAKQQRRSWPRHCACGFFISTRCILSISQHIKASLRMVQAKTGYNVKDCLAEALRDLFMKYNVSVSVEFGEGR